MFVCAFADFEMPMIDLMRDTDSTAIVEHAICVRVCDSWLGAETELGRKADYYVWPSAVVCKTRCG